ncbi:MAG: hypothetical protein WCF84_00140 [Anaerolineae bacterium]
MPSLADVARFFATLTGADVVLGLLVTAAMLILVSDWRLSLLALAVQYLLVTVLLATIVQLQVAMVRLIAGGLVAVMLYITAQRVRRNWTRRARAAGWKNAGEIAALFEREPFIVSWPFRAIALALVAVSTLTVATQFPFPNAPLLFWFLSLWLCVIGLLLIIITREALKMGAGLLTFTTGFGILYLAIDSSLLFFGLLLISDLVIALAVSHLASVPVRSGAQRQGETR